jgi:hypothetical protein
MVPMWSQVEVDAGIVAASLPSLSPLLKRLWSDLVTPRPGSASGMVTLAQPNEPQPVRPHTIGSKPYTSKGMRTYKDDGKYEDWNRAHFEMAVLRSPKEAAQEMDKRGADRELEDDAVLEAVVEGMSQVEMV